MSENRLSGPLPDPAGEAGYPADHPERVGFFTDTSVCIGCKACEVACKEWNAVPLDGLALSANSYDNTGGLGASTWRHVAFVEQTADRISAARESGRRLVELGMPGVGAPASTASPAAAAPAAAAPAGYGTLPAPVDGHGPDLRDMLSETVAVEDGASPHGTTVDGTPMVGALPEFRWLMASDVCKHCTHAGCLDVCPTGALFRSEHGTVVVQPDVCNGCGYCVGACPFGVIERRSDSSTTVRGDGHVPVHDVDEAKGLEFDEVILVDPDAIVAESPQGLQDLYVALTRATQGLTVVADGQPVSLPPIVTAP